jgi:hypothetical protein
MGSAVMALTATEAFSKRSAGIGVLSIAWLLKLLAWLFSPILFPFFGFDFLKLGDFLI